MHFRFSLFMKSDTILILTVLKNILLHKVQIKEVLGIYDLYDLIF